MKTFTQTIKLHRINFAGFAFVYALLAIVISVCGVATNVLTGGLSQAALDFDVSLFARFLLTMAGITVVNAVFAALRDFLRGRFEGRAGYKIRGGFAGFFTRLRFGEFSQKNSGEQLSVFSNDLPSAAAYIGESMLSFGAEIINVIIFLIYMFSVQPLYTLIYIVLMPALVLMQVLISAPIQKKMAVMSDTKAQFNGVVNDSLQNIPTVVAYSLEHVMEERYLAAYDKYFAAFKAYLYSFLPLVMCGSVTSTLPFLFIIAATGYNVINGQFTFSEFIAYTSVAGMATSWLGMLSQQMRRMREKAANIEKLAASMEGTEERLTDDSGKFDDTHTGSILFNNVSFSYSEDTPVLQNISLEVKKGSRVAVVGPSGSGKSTLLKLLLGLYEPTAGTINLLGADTANLSVKALRSRIAYVPQDSCMFPETIRENLSANLTEAELRRACESAGILKFIEEQPLGFDTVLTESAENISGGQRQRLAIARAYLQNAPVVLFDEATAALDPLTEAGVLRAFGETTTGKTVVMVAHRPAAIEACERVVMLEAGQIIADGTHTELMRTSPAYAALYKHMAEDAA
jgi:ATP-binding cassette subfamily B protein